MDNSIINDELRCNILKPYSKNSEKYRKSLQYINKWINNYTMDCRMILFWQCVYLDGKILKKIQTKCLLWLKKCRFLFSLNFSVFSLRNEKQIVFLVTSNFSSFGRIYSRSMQVSFFWLWKLSEAFSMFGVIIYNIVSFIGKMIMFWSVLL